MYLKQSGYTELFIPQIKGEKLLLSHQEILKSKNNLEKRDISQGEENRRTLK